MKQCIFNEKKSCDECNVCNVCEFNAKKTCDNCGKCLELEGFDIKAVNIDEVFESKEDFISEEKSSTEESPNEAKVISIDEKRKEIENVTDNQYSKELVDSAEEANTDIMDNEEMWEYIEDVKDLSEILNDGTLLKDIGHEQFPGFVVLNSDSKK